MRKTEKRGITKGGGMIKPKEKYILKDGRIVQGVTTILKNLGWNTGVLISWANRIGLQGIEHRKFLDDKASIGQLAHSIIMSEFKGEKADTSDYTANQIKSAENCLKSYYEWKKGKEIKPMLIEKMLVSEEHEFGGTPDFFGDVNGVPTLVDYKTGGIYPESTIQASTYKFLIEELGHKVDSVRILAIPREESESFSEKILTDLEIKNGFEIFKHLLVISRLKGSICRS